MRSALDGQRAWVTQALAARMVRRAAEALAGRARVMPVKGALVARRYYDHPGERPLTDCDVVVVGLSAREAARALTAAGMRVAVWSNDPNIVDMVDPGAPGIHLDVHARPLPAGYGAVTAAWMCEGAAEDRALFGAPVLLPDDGRTLVHLLGNILHDHVVNAAPHASKDVARVLARSPWAVGDFAAAIRASRLRLGCWAALGHVAAREDAPRAHALRDALGLGRAERAYVAARMRVLATAEGRTPPPLASRVVARAVSDDPRDVAEGLATALYGVVHARVAKTLL
ncbi:MAG: nucleotidyltransferase family protein [Polyangiales bacterium]